MTATQDITLARVAGLPPLREVIAAHQLSARKQLGQNFLLDLNLTRRIARAAGRLDQGTVIEIGPGPGGLTRALLMEGARRLVAIEKDARAVGALAGLVAAAEDASPFTTAMPARAPWPRLARRRGGSSPICPITSPPIC